MADLLCDRCGTRFAAGLQGRFFPEDDTHLCERCFAFTSEGEPVPSPPGREYTGRPPWPRAHHNREKRR